VLASLISIHRVYQRTLVSVAQTNDINSSVALSEKERLLLAQSVSCAVQSYVRSLR
jgi:hypothetical protein